MDSVYFKIIVVMVALAFIRPLLKILVFLVMRTVCRGWLSKVGETAINEQPDEIQLEQESEQIWTDRAEAEELAVPLRRLGFEEAGVYSIQEMEGVVVRLMAHPAQSIAACVVSVLFVLVVTGALISRVADYGRQADAKTGESSVVRTIEENGKPILNAAIKKTR